MKWLSVTGRADRRAYLATAVLLYALAYGGGLLLIPSLLGLDVPLPDRDVPDWLRVVRLPAAVAWAGIVAGMLACAVVVLGMIAVSIRRLHDANVSGFAFLLYPIVRLLLPQTPWPDTLPGLPDLVWDVLLLILPGTRGRNPFGSDPRAVRDGAPATEPSGESSQFPPG